MESKTTRWANASKTASRSFSQAPLFSHPACMLTSKEAGKKVTSEVLFPAVFRCSLCNPCAADVWEQVVSWLAPTTAGGDGAAAISAQVGGDGRPYVLAESDLKPFTAKVGFRARSLSACC